MSIRSCVSSALLAMIKFDCRLIISESSENEWNKNIYYMRDMSHFIIGLDGFT